MKFSSSIKKIIQILLFLQLFIIPSHVFSKNLSGVKLFCNTEQLEEDEEVTYRLFDFIDNENNPISLFEEKTSRMSLSLVDAEKVVPIESEDLFFKLGFSRYIFSAWAG